MKRNKYTKILEAISASTAIFSTFIIAYGYPDIGFKLAIVASLLFIIYNYITQQYALLIMSVIYLIIEIFGVIRWTNMCGGY